ncbi:MULTISPECIES: hypothetical protein [unclassified Mesorhizobium]|uniref:hypothetical protein n=1 Tax=unclassified Mesorhizobium TaxID=325217 RepID=UPI001FE17FA1|nr:MULTISPECIES: hypothetical protein [unclassified Mesorhizobium]
MLLALDDAISSAVLAGRGADVEIFGVVDLTSKIETRISALSVGHAIQFVANASVLGYDVRGAMVHTGYRARQASGNGAATACGRNTVAPCSSLECRTRARCSKLGLPIPPAKR